MTSGYLRTVASASPGRVAGATLLVILGLLFLVVPAQELLGQEIARLSLFILAFLAARRVSTTRGVEVGELGWVRPTIKDVATGFLLGVLPVAVVAAGLVSAGWYSLQWVGAWSAFGLAALHGIAVGLYEEAVFRSLWFGGLEPAIGTWSALALSAILFGFLHSFNPEATLVSSGSIALTGGLLLGAIFVVWRNIWMVAATHAAWNAMLGGFFGMPVSGSSSTDSLLRATETGPDLWTGGDFGPEASLMTVLVVGGLGLGILVWKRRSITAIGGSWRRPRSDLAH